MSDVAEDRLPELNRHDRVRPLTGEARELSPDKVVELLKGHAVVEVPYHPQVQFLTDVDGDGKIDHLYCCEAAALNYLNHLAVQGDYPGQLDPFTEELLDTLAEYTRINFFGPDAGWGAAILALLHRDPIVYGLRRVVVQWQATYRVPAERREMEAPDLVLNHDLLVVGVTEDYVLCYCTYNGPCAVPREQFDRCCGMITTTLDHEPASGKPSEVAEKVVSETGAPVIASVNSHCMNPYRLGTVPFIVAVRESWRKDWIDGLQYDLPPARDDRLCYLAAVLKKDKFPVWSAKEDWIKWLEKHQKEIIPGLQS